MDSNPQSDASKQAREGIAGDMAHKIELKTDATPKLLTGFPYNHIHLGAAMLRGMIVAQNLQDHVMQVMHVPKPRAIVLEGFGYLAQSQGLAFAALADLFDYDRAKFYDACNEMLSEIAKQADQYKIAQLAGMSLEDFQKQMAETAEKGKK